MFEWVAEAIYGQNNWRDENNWIVWGFEWRIMRWTKDKGIHCAQVWAERKNTYLRWGIVVTLKKNERTGNENVQYPHMFHGSRLLGTRSAQKQALSFPNKAESESTPLD